MFCSFYCSTYAVGVSGYTLSKKVLNLMNYTGFGAARDIFGLIFHQCNNKGGGGGGGY